MHIYEENIPDHSLLRLPTLNAGPRGDYLPKITYRKSLSDERYFVETCEPQLDHVYITWCKLKTTH
jgi:hypothetical protein